MMSNQGQTILLVSDDAAFCAAARRELEAQQKDLRVAAVSTVDAARRIMVDAAPAVILLEDTSVMSATAQSRDSIEPASQLESIVSDLAASAPVVVIGRPDHEMELAALVAAGLADFVTRAGGCLPIALGLVEQRLREARRLPASGLQPALTSPTACEGFGEVLRHELNNPLTGILGNAELLLAEVRRKNDGQLPNGGQQRLETIAALAVRLRETVRRLSLDWESRNRPRRKGRCDSELRAKVADRRAPVV
jgi:signal transduction histidine kinase